MRLSANHVGKRYVTYTNDVSVPSYWLINASVAYDFGTLGPAQNPDVALNLTNLTDKRYLFDQHQRHLRRRPDRSLATMQVGAPRQVMATATVRF